MEESIKLNLGAGPQRLEGYIGLDIHNGGGVDQIIETASKLPFDDNSVDAIYTSHMIEHIEQWELPLLLDEMNRVLKKGGYAEIICPDLEIAVKKWLKGDFKFRWSFGMRRIFGFQRKPTGDIHYGGFTQARFKDLLPRHGFVVAEIKNQASRWPRDQRMWPNGDLYVKAVKK